MGDFRKLKVWEKAHSVTVRVHRVTTMMRDQRYASLRDQMIRPAQSIPTNIVEGSRQTSNKEFNRFLGYALNSASELEYQLMLASGVGATPEDETATLINNLVEVRKMLFGLSRRLTGELPKRDDPSNTPV
jgi:four helix bundle protein